MAKRKMSTEEKIEYFEELLASYNMCIQRSIKTRKHFLGKARKAANVLAQLLKTK